MPRLTKRYDEGARVQRLERRAQKAFERAQGRGEEPVGYERAVTYGNPRMMGGMYDRPIYSRQQEIMDKIAEIYENRDPLEPVMDPSWFEMKPSSSNYRRGVLEFLADALPEFNRRGGMGKAKYGGGKSKGLDIGIFGKFDTKQKAYNCRVKGNC